MRSLLADMLPNPAVERDGLQAALAGRPSAFRAPAAPHTSTLNDSPSRSSMTATGRDATSNLLSSAPETGRSSFASRKLPDAIECSRPVAARRCIVKLTVNDETHRRRWGPLNRRPEERNVRKLSLRHDFCSGNTQTLFETDTPLFLFL